MPIYLERSGISTRSIYYPSSKPSPAALPASA